MAKQQTFLLLLSVLAVFVVVVYCCCAPVKNQLVNKWDSRLSYKWGDIDTDTPSKHTMAIPFAHMRMRDCGLPGAPRVRLCSPTWSLSACVCVSVFCLFVCVCVRFKKVTRICPRCVCCNFTFWRPHFLAFFSTCFSLALLIFLWFFSTGTLTQTAAYC